MSRRHLPKDTQRPPCTRPQFRPGFQSRGNCLITFIPGGTYLVSIGIRHPGRSTCARLHGPVVQVVGGFGHSYNRAYSVDSVLAIFAILTVFAVFTILTVLAVLYGNIASFRERDDIPSSDGVTRSQNHYFPELPPILSMIESLGLR